MGYIYGIFADDRLIYIGKTTRDLEKRFKEHKTLSQNINVNSKKVHKLIKWYKEQGAIVIMTPLRETTDEVWLGLEEKHLIETFKPIGNMRVG